VSNFITIFQLTDETRQAIITTMVVNIVQELQSLGFSEYEARSYMALLSSGTSLSAYEIAKSAGLPTSKIYGVLARLEERELVAIVDGKGKKKFAAMDPDEFFSQFRQDINNTIAKVSHGLKQVKGNVSATAIWNFRDYDSFRERCTRIVNGSTKYLLISAWEQEMKFLESALKTAEKRGVHIAIIHFGEPCFKIGAMYPHPLKDTLYEERGGRAFVMVSDSKEAVLATICGESAVEGAFSLSRGFILLAEDYIKHDIYVMKIVYRMERQLIKRFGPRYRKLRDVFSDLEEQQE
jgi:HTH-type transcriptional regulator, sugar sensing transcriptional regulator